HGRDLQHRRRRNLPCRRSPDRSNGMTIIRRLLLNPKAAIGLVILAIAVLAAFLAPIAFPRDPCQMVSRPFLPPFQDPGLWLGTDMLGRDILAGLAYGAQVSLIVGIVSTVIAAGVGILVGAVAGYYGGLLDD